MRTPSRPDEDEPPGGRALQRLQQFEQERGYEQSEIPGEKPEAADAQQPDDPCAEPSDQGEDERQEDSGDDLGDD